MLIHLLNTAQAAVSLPNLNTTQDLGGFISSIYSFSISVVGILVFVRFIWAGWIYLTAAGNAGSTSKATEMMKGAAIGAVLLFSSYLILYIINPDLVSETFSFGILGEQPFVASKKTSPATDNQTAPASNTASNSSGGQLSDTDLLAITGAMFRSPLSVEPGSVKISENPTMTFSATIFGLKSSIFSMNCRAGAQSTYKTQYRIYRIDDSGAGQSNPIPIVQTEVNTSVFDQKADYPINYTQKLNSPPLTSGTKSIYYTIVYECWDPLDGWKSVAQANRGGGAITVTP